MRKKLIDTTKVDSLRKLAEVLDMHVQQLHKESQRTGFPAKGRDGWDVAMVKEWRRRSIINRPGRRASSASPAPATAPTPAASTKLPTNFSALEISRQAVQLCWSAITAGSGITSSAADSLKKVLGELRQAENDYISLEERRGNLITREQHVEAMGSLAAKLVSACGILENSIATEFSIWLADPAIRAMSSDERARKIREFVTKTCRVVRDSTADAIAGKLPDGVD